MDSAPPLMRHVDEVDARREAEHFAGQVRDVAGARVREVELAGIGLGVGDELLNRSWPETPGARTRIM